MYGYERLLIKEIQGNKALNDKKILVEGKPLTIRDLLRMVSLMAANERRINLDKIARNNRFFFAEAIQAALTGEDINNICRRFLIPDKGMKTYQEW
ncbi:hypothetical protein KKE60_04810 [Patescibacteria group bacterium]|nr:hypothetical protein [Patescibacteria group bacterium]